MQITKTIRFGSLAGLAALGSLATLFYYISLANSRR